MRGSSSPILQKMLDIKLLGKKNKRGFYIHEGKNQSVNPELKTFQFHNKTFIKAEIVDRAILMMVNEAARCLEEGIIKDASSLDMAMIMGTGFPPFRGGLLKYADSIGIEKVHLTLLHLEEKYGSRFAPAQLICTMAEKKEYFYKG